MNQIMNATISLSEAFLRAGNVVCKQRLVNHNEAQSYTPTSDVLYFQAAQTFSGMEKDAFDPQDSLHTSVFVVGTIKSKKDYHGCDEANRRLLEEPDDVKIGTHATSNRSFLIHFKQVAAFDQPSINLNEALYGKSEIAAKLPERIYA